MSSMNMKDPPRTLALGCRKRVEALSGKGKCYRIAFMKFRDASFVPGTRKSDLLG